MYDAEENEDRQDVEIWNSLFPSANDQTKFKDITVRLRVDVIS